MELHDNVNPIHTHEIAAIANHSHSDRHHGRGHSGSTILFIFLSCLFGAVTRSLVKGTNLPFTVLIFILGCALGILSVLIEEVSVYTLLADIDPHLMLHIFLPVLIFDSAFALEPHTFIKSFAQVVLLAVPCFMLSAFLSGILVKYIFPYDWPWPVALAFGTIISATDPVAVVATLHELGADKKLAILLEGESLLNDGAALVFFTVFLQMARGDYDDAHNTGGVIAIFFVRVLFGGVLLGYVMGKVCSAWLAKIFNDAVVETLITIAFPYITYFLAEAVLGVSGVLSVVILGAVLSSEKTSISPEVERFLHSQWSLLAFVSNTLIFILVGIVITEQGIRELSDKMSYTSKDWFYMAVLYLGITVIRGFSLLVFSPVLKLLGYGFDWSKGIVMWWGALRGAVSLALALLVAEDDFLDPHSIGNKFLMHAAGIVVLTLVVNGCTMRLLLNTLGLTDISMAKKMAMAAAVKALEETQKSMVSTLKSDRFLADAHWDVVMLMSEIKDPYADRGTKESGLKFKVEAEGQIAEQAYSPAQVVCPDCSSLIRADLTASQYKEYEEDARIRYLKAQKVSYWRQFEHGLLGRSAVRKLLELTESTTDKVGAFISLDEVRSSWKMRGIYRSFPKISRFLTTLCSVLIPRPISEEVKDTFFCKLAVSKLLRWLVITMLLLQTATGVIDLLMFIYGLDYHIIFFVLSLNFTFFFGVEIVIKVAGLGWQRYWRRFWNGAALLSIALAFPELYAGYEAERLTQSNEVVEAEQYHVLSAVIRISRGMRLIEVLLDTCLPAVLKVVDRRIESQINFGYDVGRGFVVGEEECRALLDHIVEHPTMRDKFKNICDRKRLAVVKELALLQRNSPGVAVAVKTRQATRTVLNKIIETLDKLKADGLLDEQEADRLHKDTDKLIKLLVSAPPSVPPMPAEHMLSFVPWLQGGDNSIARFMKQRAQLINFDYNDVILHIGDAPKGIYIIVSGLVKIFGRQRLHSTFPADMSSISHEGIISNDRYTDYLGAGAVLGEMGPLMDSHMTATVTAETAVQLYYLNITDLEMAFDMYPDVKIKLWKNCAIKMVLNLLAEHSEFMNIPTEAARSYLEKGYVPRICEETVYNLDDNISYAFLVHGRVKVYDRPDLELNGPSFIPSSIRVLLLNDPQETILYLVPAEEIPLVAVDSFHEGIRNKLRVFASSMGQKLLQTKATKKSTQKRRPTFYDIINMLRIKKLLNRKTTGTLVERPAKSKQSTQIEVKEESSKLSAVPTIKLSTKPTLEDPAIKKSNALAPIPVNDDESRRTVSAPVLGNVRSELHQFASLGQLRHKPTQILKAAGLDVDMKPSDRNINVLSRDDVNEKLYDRKTRAPKKETVSNIHSLSPNRRQTSSKSLVVSEKKSRALANWGKLKSEHRSLVLNVGTSSSANEHRGNVGILNNHSNAEATIGKRNVQTLENIKVSAQDNIVVPAPDRRRSPAPAKVKSSALENWGKLKSKHHSLVPNVDTSYIANEHRGIATLPHTHLDAEATIGKRDVQTLENKKVSAQDNNIVPAPDRGPSPVPAKVKSSALENWGKLKSRHHSLVSSDEQKDDVSSKTKTMISNETAIQEDHKGEKLRSPRTLTSNMDAGSAQTMNTLARNNVSTPKTGKSSNSIGLSGVKSSRALANWGKIKSNHLTAAGSSTREPDENEDDQSHNAHSKLQAKVSHVDVETLSKVAKLTTKPSSNPVIVLPALRLPTSKSRQIHPTTSPYIPDDSNNSAICADSSDH